MRKSIVVYTALAVLVLASCKSEPATATQIFFDTAVTLTADCSEELLSGAFSLCDEYEKSLSRTREDSEVSLLSQGERTISDDTLELINKGLYYGSLSNGGFDITIAPLSDIWDFYEGVVPSNDEIAEALKNVDYGSIEIAGNSVNTNGKRIDLGGIAKGYISDKLLLYFKGNNVKSGIINLGGNITVFGDRYYNIGIKKPFYDNEISATLKVKNKSISTSGIYERYFESNGKLYHHILDTNNGYPVDTDLYSATVIGECSTDCDALATICVLYGEKRAKELIGSTENFEAVFIDKDYRITVTDGLKAENGVIKEK